MANTDRADFLFLLNVLPNILCDTALLKVLSHLKYAKLVLELMQQAEIFLYLKAYYNPV